MNVPAIGENYLIDGFKTFIITGNKEKDIIAFAQANNMSVSEAEKVFNNVPALRNFTEYLGSQDEEENIVITDDELDDNSIPQRNTTRLATMASNLGNISNNINLKELIQENLSQEITKKLEDLVSKGDVEGIAAMWQKDGAISMKTAIKLIGLLKQAILLDDEGNYIINGEKAVKNEDGTFTVTNDNYTKTYTEQASLSSFNC